MTDPTGLFSLMEISAGLGIQDVLKAVDMGRTAVQYRALTGKAEVLQEALFWGQFAAAGPILAAELFDNRGANASIDVTFDAKRYINVFNSSEKVVEAKVGINFARNGDRKLGFEFKWPAT